MLVLAIISTLALIAAPRYANALSRYRVDLAAQRVIADLSLAQAQAKATSNSWTVSFNDAADTYTFFDGTTFASATQKTAVDLTEPPYHASIASPDFDGDAQVIFDGYGVADSGGTVIVRSGGFRKLITLDGATSKIVVAAKEVEL
ncbi:MAG: hypothetical protein JSV91_11015 [Phycisphaerales bacterium]|nr:MAG: hypothetical protein JSV91_11015 [Phycisphaerales bacterium]